MSVILGLNTSHAGSSAALLVDGVPQIAIAEERLNRIKYYAGFPKLAIQYCLDYTGLQASDIDGVAIGRDSSANRLKKLEFVARNPTKLLNLLGMRAARKKLGNLQDLMAAELGVPADSLRFQQYNVEHHLAHIASAYYLSGWDEAAGFSLDGSGDFVTCMMAECKGREIDVKHRIFVPHSMGSLYTMVCEFIGYDRYGDEGKVMGLAPLGKNTYKEIFDDMLILEEEGIRLNSKYFMPFGSNQGLEFDENGQVVLSRHYSDHMIELFGEPRKRHAEITQRDMDLAFGLQYVFEIGYMHLLNILHRKVPHERVAMAGGCALNSVANGKLFHHTPFRETFIQPAAGDDGLALGAALYVSQQMLQEPRTPRMTNAYLGPEYSEAEIQAALEERQVVYRRLEEADLLQHCCDELEKGNVLGWFQGRMEWGPRALGSRSILAHPGLPDMKDTLNARIKHREAFRPFAPAILEECQNEVFEYDHPSPFMLHVYKIRPEWRERLPAVNHVDDTGRLQTVNEEESPLYYRLIKAFYGRSGIPIILNTSFNENEPIVCEPQEAIDCFLRTKMDSLAIGPFFCTKTP
ncbi:MAG: carbamoyltransferase [Saprospiraceae bacterium]|nr:carbamoyltransferase [Saprospiraceae bacterium]